MMGILKLNDGDVGRNPAIGSHDPSMMWDPVTEKYYSYATDVYQPQFGLADKIGIPVRVSIDMVHFTYQGTVLSPKAIAQGRDNGEYPPTGNFWAPFTEYVQGEYRMYYSATKAFGSSESRIWLAVSDKPEGPFENRGVVADTWGTDDTFPNAIDPHVIWDKERCYLVYGSFFAGIYIKELDGQTGLAKSGDPKELGICISRKAKNPVLDGPEGASVIYVPESGYFYLFQSYGWLGDNYDIRVGRSRKVTGPYADMQGKNLVEDSMGVKVANSYKFRAEHPYACQGTNGWNFGGFRGPGHGVPFYSPVTEEYFFVHHIRDGAEINCSYDPKENRNSYEPHYMMIRRMLFVDGWPVLSPQPYTGGNLEPVSPKEAEGRWEIVVLDEESNDMKCSQEYKLDENSMYLNNGILYKSWDFENQKNTVCVSGFEDSGLAYWGKLMYNIV